MAPAMAELSIMKTMTLCRRCAGKAGGPTVLGVMALCSRKTNAHDRQLWCGWEPSRQKNDLVLEREG